MELRSQIARNAAARQRIERSFAQRLEFVTAYFDHRNGLVGPDQRPLHYEFKRANVMQAERPGYSQFHIALAQDSLISLKTNGFAAKIASPAGADVSHPTEPI